LRNVETAIKNAFNPVKVKYALHFTEFNETFSSLTAFRGGCL